MAMVSAKRAKPSSGNAKASLPGAAWMACAAVMAQACAASDIAGGQLIAHLGVDIGSEQRFLRDQRFQRLFELGRVAMS